MDAGYAASMRFASRLSVLTTALLALFLLMPLGPAVGFEVNGRELDLDQRDFRVFDNFTDATANDNGLASSAWPGYAGAVRAIWKGCVEWSSAEHSSVSGDPLQPTIGDGGANFDASFQGRATNAGGPGANVHSEISGGDGPGGVLAFTEVGASGGWRIRYERFELWEDGPGAPGTFGEDLQSVACHEYGHALGLGHSTDPAATMFPTRAGGSTAARSIEIDDQAGAQAIYGAATADKPTLSSVTVSTGPGTVTATITGAGFAPAGNRVWFTQKTAGGDGEPVRVDGVASALAGTEITVVVPPAAGPGDVLVQSDQPGYASLSQPYPFDGSGPEPGAPTIASVAPAEVPSLQPFNTESVTLLGSGFDSITEVRFSGTPLPTFPPTWTIVDANTLTLAPPIQNALDTASIEVSGPLGSASVNVPIVARPTPVVRVQDGSEPAPFFSINSTVVRVGGSPGNLLILVASLQLGPADVPGLFHLDITNNLQQFFNPLTFVAEPQGWSQLAFEASNLPFDFTVYWQVLEFDVVRQSFPLIESNVSTATFVF